MEITLLHYPEMTTSSTYYIHLSSHSHTRAHLTHTTHMHTYTPTHVPTSHTLHTCTLTHTTHMHTSHSHMCTPHTHDTHAHFTLPHMCTPHTHYTHAHLTLPHMCTPHTPTHVHTSHTRHTCTPHTPTHVHTSHTHLTHTCEVCNADVKHPSIGEPAASILTDSHTQPQQSGARVDPSCRVPPCTGKVVPKRLVVSHQFCNVGRICHEVRFVHT